MVPGRRLQLRLALDPRRSPPGGLRCLRLTPRTFAARRFTSNEALAQWIFHDWDFLRSATLDVSLRACPEAHQIG